jgi:hypothetical protein
VAEPTAVERMRLVKLGYSMPDGSYYIRAGNVGASDLQNAIRDVGRGQEDSHNAIRVHIMKRAKALGLSDEIPDNWQADGSLKHDALDNLADGFLSHFGITGMRWGGHLPGTEAAGGKGNPDGANGPSAKYATDGGDKKAAFIQRGDHSGSNSGDDNGPSGKDDVKNPEQQANQSVDFLKNLRDHVAQKTEEARAESEDADHAPSSGLGALGNHSQGEPSGQDSEPPPPKTAPASPAASPKPKPKSSLTSQQAAAVHAASKNHLAAVSQLHNKAKAAQVAHKKNKKKIATHPVKAHVKRTTHAASKQHAAHMHHLAQAAAAAHKAHQEAVAKLKSKHRPLVNAKPGSSHLNAQDKAALKQLSPVQRSALNKIPANLRAHASSLSLKQQNNLRLTPNERASLSKLSPKQKAALAKATAASAKKRHEAALAKKAGIAGNKSVAAAKKQTVTAQAHRSAAQKAAYNKLRLNAQNGTRHVMEDAAGTYLEHEDDIDRLADGFLEHHGIKGMHWGVRKAVSSGGSASKVAFTGVKKTLKAAKNHPTEARAVVGLTAYGAYLGKKAYDHREEIVGTAKIVAHIIKVMNQQRKSKTGQEALAIAKTGMKFVQGYVIHEDDSESIEHHGVKGMHWGIRNDRGHEGERVKSAKLGKLDKKFASKGVKHLVDIHNKAAEVMNSTEIPRINNMPKFKGQDFTHDSPLRREYYNEYAKTLEKHLNAAADELGTNPSGTLKYRAVVNKDLSWNLHAEEVKHADGDSITIRPKYDDSGYIVSFGSLSPDEMSQTSIDESLEFLAHYGIKGMHWGVRRNGGHPGREEHPVSSDAQKAHEVARTIHEHGTAAVGNEDLQHLVNRQRLLQQHAQLNPGDPSHYRKGLDYVKSLTNDVNTVVNAVNTGQRAVKTAQGFSSERPAHRQGRRTRNKPLKVVDIRAA